MIKKTLKINGVERILILDKDETLAQVLREHLLLTGCKIGCGEGHCGACNVIMNGKVTRSCIYKMSRVPDNAEITTIEGVGTISDMHPIPCREGLRFHKDFLQWYRDRSWKAFRTSDHERCHQEICRNRL